MEPLQGYEILKEHLTNQDNLIRQKVLGLFMGNSVLLVAFFMSKSAGNFDIFRCFLAGAALGLCVGFTLSLVGDIRAKRESIKGLQRIEETPDFAYLKGIYGRPLMDVERRARGPLKLRQIVDFFWPILPLGFAVIWTLALKGELT